MGLFFLLFLSIKKFFYKFEGGVFGLPFSAGWVKVQIYFGNILKSLTEKYKIQYNTPPAFKETIRAVVNSNNWIFAHSI